MHRQVKIAETFVQVILRRAKGDRDWNLATDVQRRLFVFIRVNGTAERALKDPGVSLHHHVW